MLTPRDSARGASSSRDPASSSRDLGSSSRDSLAAGLHVISTLELLSASAAAANEHSTRAEQLDELERLVAEALGTALAALPSAASGSREPGQLSGACAHGHYRYMYLAEPPSARLSACLLLLRAEASEKGRRVSLSPDSETVAGGVPGAPDTIEPLAMRSEVEAFGFVESVGSAVVSSSASPGGTTAVLCCERRSTPAKPLGAPPLGCVGRGAWQRGEANGIVCFSFKILASKQADGSRMRLGIVAQGARGSLDYALWFSPCTGTVSESAHCLAAEREVSKLGEPVMQGNLGTGKANQSQVDVQADTLKNELRFSIVDGDGYRHPWTVATIRKKPVPLPAVFAPVVRLGRPGDAVELSRVSCYLPGGVLREQLRLPPLGVLTSELEIALAMPDPSISADEIAAAKAWLAESRQVQGQAEQGHGCPFVWIDAEALRSSAEAMPRMLPLQLLRQRHPEWLIEETITLEAACKRSFASDHLAVSHRWDEREEPDPTGVQLEAIRAFLIQRPHIKQVWIDYCCLPQAMGCGSPVAKLGSTVAEADARNEAERQQFRLQLKNVNLLYLGVGVLILTDRSYLSRFWTNFEAWLSMQDVSPEGLVSARHAHRRCSIMCVHNAPEALVESLVEEWSNCTAQKAFEKLSSADVMCTNLSDKEVQLPKILELDQRVAALALAFSVQREPSPDTPKAAQWDDGSERTLGIRRSATARF